MSPAKARVLSPGEGAGTATAGHGVSANAAVAGARAVATVGARGEHGRRRARAAASAAGALANADAVGHELPPPPSGRELSQSLRHGASADVARQQLPLSWYTSCCERGYRQSVSSHGRRGIGRAWLLLRSWMPLHGCPRDACGCSCTDGARGHVQTLLEKMDAAWRRRRVEKKTCEKEMKKNRKKKRKGIIVIFLLSIM